MVARVAAGVRAAHGSRRTAGAGARVDALVAVTGQGGAAISVLFALASAARDERVAEESGAAEADGSVVAAAVRARFAVGIVSARVRVAQIALIERSAFVERVAGGSFGAAADGLVVVDAALGARAARSVARVDALEVEAGLFGAALVVLRALRIAARERIAEEVDRT